MTLCGTLILGAGAAWPFWGVLIGRDWGTLGILIGLSAGSFIGIGVYWGTDRAADWLFSRVEHDHPSTPFKRALSWLILPGVIAWAVISNMLAVTITTGLFTLYLPAASRAPWEVAISNGAVYLADDLAQHPAQVVFVGLICMAMVWLLSFLMFDRLLRIQFSEAHSDWERQGCMSGYSWSPPGCRETSMRERGELLGKWLSDPPYWLRSRAPFWRRLGFATMVVLFCLAVISLLWGLPALLFAYFNPVLMGAVVLIFLMYKSLKERREHGR